MGKALIDSFLAKPRYVRMVDINSYTADGTIPVEEYGSNLASITSYYIENLIWTKFQSDNTKIVMNVLDQDKGRLYMNSKSAIGQSVLEKTYDSTVEDAFAIQAKMGALQLALYMGDEEYIKREYPRLHAFSEAWGELQNVIPSLQQTVLNILANGEAAVVLPLDIIYGSEDSTLLERLEADGYSVTSFYGNTAASFQGGKDSCSIDLANAFKDSPPIMQSLAPGGTVSRSCGKVDWPLIWEVKNAQGKASTILGTDHYINPLLIADKVINRVLSHQEIWFETEIDRYLQQSRARFLEQEPDAPKELVEYSFGNVLFDEYLYRLASLPSLKRKIEAFNTLEEHLEHTGRFGLSTESIEQKMQTAMPIEKVVESMLERETLVRRLFNGQIRQANASLKKRIEDDPKLGVLLERDKAWKKNFIEGVKKGDRAFVVGYVHVAGGHSSSFLEVAKREGFTVKQVPISGCKSGSWIGLKMTNLWILMV